jgi:hypothetical protein
MIVGNELPGTLGLFAITFYANDFAREANACREEIKTAPWATPDFDHLPTLLNTDLVKLPA